MPVPMPSPIAARPWDVAANDNAPPVSRMRFGGGRSFRRRMLGLFTAVFLISGAVMHLVNIEIESVVISHASRTAMIFGLIGLRRITHEDEKNEIGQA